MKKFIIFSLVLIIFVSLITLINALPTVTLNQTDAPSNYNLDIETILMANASDVIIDLTETYVNISNGIGQLEVDYNSTNGTFRLARVFGVGDYTINWSIQNESGDEVVFNNSFSIAKNVSEIILELDGFQASKTVDNTASVNFYSELEFPGDQNISINITNSTGSSFGGSSNIDTYDEDIVFSTPGVYTVNSTFGGDDNYTSIYKNFTLTVNQETNSPTMTINNLSSPSTYHSRVESIFRFNATDLGGINQSSAYLNISNGIGNIPLSYNSTNGTYYYSRIFGVGTYNYNFSISDIYGNEETTDNSNFTININNSVISLLLDGAAENENKDNTQSTSISASLVDISDQNISITIVNSTGSSFGGIADNITFYDELTFTNPDVYTVNASSAGNTNYTGTYTSYTINVSLETTSPTVTINETNAPAVYNPSTFTVLRMNVTDVSGIINSSAYVNISNGIGQRNVDYNTTNGTYRYATEVFGAGDYTLNWSVQDNYGNEVVFNNSFSIAQNSSDILLLINGSQDNITTEVDSIIVINSSLLYPSENITVYINNTENQQFGGVINNVSYLNNSLFSVEDNYIVTAQYAGNANYSSLTKQFTIIMTDLNLFQINSINFANNSLINLSSEFNITFSDNLSSTNGINLYVNGVILDFIKEITNNVISVFSQTKLNENSTILLTLDDTITNSSGSSLISNYTYNFTSWFSDVDLDSNPDYNESGVNDDMDNDGLNNSLDNIVGNITSIHTNYDNLSLEVNDSENIFGINYTGVQNVKFKNSGSDFIEFEFNFSGSDFDLRNVSIVNDPNFVDFFAIFGLNVSSKNVTFTNVNATTSDLCIIDNSTFNMSDITDDCSGDDEIFVECDGALHDGYVCSKTSNQFNISGLSHTGIKPQCSEDWDYGSWSSCSGSSRTRTADDLNNCGTIHKRESLTLSCTSSSSSSGGSGGGSSSSTSTVVVNTPAVVEEETVVKDIVVEENEINNEGTVLDSNNGGSNGGNSNGGSSGSGGSSGGGSGGSSSSNKCLPNTINFNLIDKCGFETFDTEFTIGDITTFNIISPKIYFDKKRNIYYIPKDVEFTMVNTDETFNPRIIFEGGVSMDSKAQEFLLDYRDDKAILIVKKGKITIQIKEVVDVVDSGNAFITSTIDGKKVKTKFNNDLELNSVLKDIRQQLKDGNDDIYVIQSLDGSSEDNSYTLILILGVLTLSIFSVFYYGSRIKEYFENKSFEKKVTSQNPLSDVPDLIKPEITLSLPIKKSPHKKVIDYASKVFHMFTNGDNICKLDDLFLKGKIHEKDYETRLRRLLEK